MFKKAVLALSALVITLVPLASVKVAALDNPNLIANASVESAGDSGGPASWKADNWGTNTTSLTYKNEGHTGSKSLYVDMSAHTDGDAKWMHDPVSVTPGSTYTYASYYKSNVETELDAQYTTASGQVSYAYLQSVGPSADWQQVSAALTVPANVTKAVIMHIVYAPGWLQTDDFSLTANTNNTPPPTPPASPTNLVSNPSMETANAKGTLPVGWHKDKWGSNTATLSYKKDGGHTGNNSVYVNMAKYSSGDAKWYFTPVKAEPNKSYTFTDYYQSNVETKAVVQYTDTSGTLSYADIGTALASSSWKLFEASFTTPSNVKQVTVLHLIEKVGWLNIDDVSLAEEAPTPPPPVDSGIPNNSVETASVADPNTPASWNRNSWGSNNASFEYLNEGHTGNHSVKVTISNYTDGDAKWYFDPITSLTPGKMYRFNVWYKTNSNPQVSAMLVKKDGTTTYNNLPVAIPDGSSNWQLYTDTFAVPEDVAAVSVFMFLPSNGWVQTDDYSIAPYIPVGFNRPLITLTFDDGFEENVTSVKPILDQYGFKSTQCYTTEYAAQSQNAVLAFKNDGHEICSHTITHPFLTQLSDTDLNNELSQSQKTLQQMTGEPVADFASPYGDYNAQVLNAIKKYYRSHRTVDEGYNSKDNFNIYRIRVQNMLSTTTLAEYQSWLDYAKATNTWLVLVYHRVDTQDIGPYDTYASDFSAQMQALSQSGLTVKTWSAALDELTAQL